jgi:hypothetical protein
MNKKLIRLTESDLHRIIKKSVSNIIKEAYGTPSLDDMAAQKALMGGSSNSNGEINRLNRIAQYIGELQMLANTLVDVDTLSSQPSMRGYANAFLNKIDELDDIYQQIRRVKTMELGMQPDAKYDLKHLSMDSNKKASYHDVFDPLHKVKDKDIPQDFMWYDQNDMNKHIKQNKNVGKGRTYTSI